MHMKARLRSELAQYPQQEVPKTKLLETFFGKHQSPVDICIILDGALGGAHLLADHIKEDNILFYRPQATHRNLARNAFLQGKPHPERTLLLFDSDMVTGNAMRESAEYFAQQGYKRENIFGFLEFGSTWRNYTSPELMHVDDLLRR